MCGNVKPTVCHDVTSWKVGFGLSVLTHEITHSTCASRFWSADTELLYFQSVKFKLRQGKKNKIKIVYRNYTMQEKHKL